MGLFKRKYSLSKALEIVKKDKDNRYTAVPINPEDINTQYTIELIEEVQTRIKECKNRVQLSKKQSFRNRINGDGTYPNLKPIRQVQNYNNYQSAKRYNEYR
jgi:hypothetical protein